jgi:hypothetical protein
MKEVLLKLEDTDYRTVEWISQKLELSVSECLRSFIPRLSPPEIRMLTGESEIATANSDDLVPITREVAGDDLRELNAILGELKERGWAVTLANEIHQQIIERKADRKCLTVATYSRLSKWITPHRGSRRERFVKPRAQRISEILFGRPIDRID